MGAGLILPSKNKIIGDFIMRGIHATNPDRLQFYMDDIREFVDSLKLPDRVCSDCEKTIMSFFEWHMAQGMCEKCADETFERMREEGYGEID